MTWADKTILVIGATGNQGGAAAASLLAAGWRVRALTRDPAAPKAVALAAAGAEVVAGDLDDRGSLDAAVRGVYGVFSVQSGGGHDPRFPAADEIRQGRAVADAALAAGAAHLVYTSVAGAERDTGIPSWETKWVIEQHIREIGVPATVLLPVMFMENTASRGPVGLQADGTITHMVPPDEPVQVIAVRDIGAFAALAFADPDEYVGARLELAGDELTFPAIAAALSEALNRPARYRQQPVAALLGDDYARSRAGRPPVWGVWQADIPALRSRHPELLDFRTWLAGHRHAFAAA